MRVLSPVVQFLVLSMFCPFEYLFLGGSIALELVGDNHPWCKALGLEQFPEELLSSTFVSSALH